MRGMTPDDIYELTGAQDPRVSPDGTMVAYVVWRVDKENNKYPSAIWLAPVDGSTPPRQLTAGEKHDADPRWSPDGTRITFTSTRGDDDEAHLYVLPLDGGEPRLLAKFKKESVTSPAWSPDGQTIAFVARVRDAAYEEEEDEKRAPRRITRLAFKLDSVDWTFDRPQHIFTVPADGSADPNQLTSGDFEDGMPAWSPDGTRIAFASARHPDWDIVPGKDIFIVQASGGEPQQLTKTDAQYYNPSWSADGSRIACHVYPGMLDDPRHTQVAVIDVATGARITLTESLDRNCDPYPSMREPVWQGKQILFACEDGGNTVLALAPADGSAAAMGVLGGEQILTGFDMVAGQGVHTATTPAGLSELFYGQERLTEVGRAFSQARALSDYERFTAISKDGTEVDAWLVKPANFESGRRYPALLNIHGGPFTQYGNRFFDEFHVYSGAGYAVLFCNPRGSAGYAEEWGRAIRGPANDQGPGWGSVDYEDCMAAVDTALEKFDFLDGDRLGVIGGSYGGYMTSWIVGHTDRFKAAVSERAVNDWISMYGSSDFGWSFKGEVGAFLHEDYDAWRRISPTAFATNIRTPLLILHSEKDLRCNVEQAEQLFTTLRLLKREVEFVRFPGESHELSRSGSPAHRVMRFEIILEWFARYLKPDVAS